MLGWNYEWPIMHDAWWLGKKRSGGGGGAQSTNMQRVINASITRWPTRMRGSTPRNHKVPSARPDAHELVMEMQFKG
ncbi:hypothetical protein K443DRAFT_255982 [Laccaria amethystina LaAM-08-1]|uniref:Uncharacterized protein n=1 Tax=Laccaria amethystina LaAM-08-1 TaxID=1095629 RepID=A0A0C9XMD3_9AGAR|nr:hypothetical protein K443DRAFT_255982 [Laccaria amethystina LaAM-08-1]